ncbi:hypothetical protein [Stenotrophomonas sp.]|uniref:hypothetical protein n=1 Tax=Stenotrophomonas sp. TaxID=69392 RepID=UPI002D221A68|nr:hypothetical protein [Stenotrophomonas sp.]HYQ25132.1 hypothetical protein [Stenotrophomonas sp.]
MADYQQNLLASLQGGLNFGQQIKKQRDTNQLNQLASLSYSAPMEQRNSLLGQMAAIDLEAAQQQQKAFVSDDDRRTTTMVNMAKLLTTMPPEARESLYNNRMLPELQKMGVSGAPRWSPETEAVIMKSANDLYMAGTGGQMPTDVRSFQMMTAGLSPEDREKARRINLGLAGRESSAAITYQKVRGPDGLERLVAVDPRQIGAQVVGDGSGYGSFASQQQPTIFRGAGGEVVDVSQVTEPGLREAIMQNPTAWGLVPDGGSVQMPDRMVNAPGGPTMNPFVGRSPEDQAALTEAAKAGVENANFPNRLSQERQLQDVKTQGAITQAAGTAAAEAQAKDASQRPKRIQQYRQALSSAGNVETSLDKALGLLSPYSTGFVGARSRGVEGSPSYNLAAELETIKANLGFDRLQQMRDSSPTGGALGAIAVQELVALQSTIANLDPNQSEDQIRTNLDRVKTHYKNWRSAVQQSLADEERAQSERPAASPAARAPAAASSASSYSNLWN